jgi:uncharacterized protein YndB with AHSA1/START domain
LDPASTDRIENMIFLRAPKDRVWRALADSAEFGAWFRLDLDGPFAAGRPISGRLTWPGYENLKYELQVERLDAETVFSFRWHPMAVDPRVDYSQEPTTLVEFHLHQAEGGTLLRLVESGFDRLPAARRAEAFRLNVEGWRKQLDNLTAHVAA